MSFKIELTEPELETLDKAIQQLPFYLAAPLFQKINSQIQPQRVTEEAAGEPQLLQEED